MKMNKKQQHKPYELIRAKSGNLYMEGAYCKYYYQLPYAALFEEYPAEQTKVVLLRRVEENEQNNFGVRLCKLINKETNILLLDEPTNHLDADAKDELKRALQEYKGSVLLICHEPEFYRDVVTEIWDCTKWTTKII